ncbi:linear amide C-N hydrolase [Acinetobacter cumulans]|uniref:linear amide C-N hydrolase n=1 Tax=Acinetobacter cumulans TaxID=2136182 RepID=UPI002076FA2C|nr:linear amide C-N hydrolase [Acinetobacter cumulans]
MVFQGERQNVMTARFMDWKSDVGTNLWILYQGVKRSGNAGKNSTQWTSKYGSVIATGYDIATTDGLNEKGLNANLLWLVESEYPQLEQTKKPTLSISLWAQYMLDNFATMAESVQFLQKEPFAVISDQVPGEQGLATLHLSLSDATGDSSIIEYIAGKQVIHHDASYQVMTNSPIFDQQLALNQYWKQIGGTTFLPGTNRAADRFARASFYIHAIPKNAETQFSLASVFSVIRNVPVPFGLNTEEEPNISSTRWRTVADHKNLKYYFESTVSPNVFWVDLKQINFKQSQTRKLDLGKDQAIAYAGDAAAKFVETAPFSFFGVNP